MWCETNMVRDHETNSHEVSALRADEIKARLPTSAVVGRRVRLAKAGREWKGLSPFNKEKSPSFFVNDAKQAWFDFSSGRNGDIFTFVMETEGLSFPKPWSGWRRRRA